MLPEAIKVHRLCAIYLPDCSASSPSHNSALRSAFSRQAPLYGPSRRRLQCQASYERAVSALEVSGQQLAYACLQHIPDASGAARLTGHIQHLRVRQLTRERAVRRKAQLDMGGRREREWQWRLA